MNRPFAAAPLLCLSLWCCGIGAQANLFQENQGSAEASPHQSWMAALAGMALPAETKELNRTNCVDLMLQAFRSNPAVKALIFSPGATDEFYLWSRAKASLEVSAPSLLDAVTALTNQTLIRVTFRQPLLVLHTQGEPLEPEVEIQDHATAAQLRNARLAGHLFFDDRDWDAVQPVLKWALKIDLRPWQHSADSWHFYRHNFAGWNLNGWEALEATALAGKTRFTVRKRQVIFELDKRRPRAGQPQS